MEGAFCLGNGSGNWLNEISNNFKEKITEDSDNVIVENVILVLIFKLGK